MNTDIVQVIVRKLCTITTDLDSEITLHTFIEYHRNSLGTCKYYIQYTILGSISAIMIW